MVNSNSTKAINTTSFSSPINNAIYQNFVNILKKGTNNENVNPNINNKTSNSPRKFKIIENQNELLSISHSNFNIIKNTVNTNETPIPSLCSVKTTTNQRTKKFNNRRLNFEILTRIFILSDDPKSFSLVCRQWYYVTKEVSSKLLWFVNRIPKEIICIYLFTHPIYHVHFDANFLRILLKNGAKLDLHFLEQAIPILLKNKNGISNGKELGIPSISYIYPKLERSSLKNEIKISQNTNVRDNSSKRKSISRRRESICSENDNEINKYLNDLNFKNNLYKYYIKFNDNKLYYYHYKSNLLPLLLFLYHKSKKQYISFVEDINTLLKRELTNPNRILNNINNNQNNNNNNNNQDNTFLIEDYRPIISINESINLFLNSYKNETMIPIAILESMFSSNNNTFSNHDTIIRTITHFYGEIKNNSIILPLLKNYLHHLVYHDHFIPYNIVQKPYNSKQIRVILQFMEVVWFLEPEIIFTWIEWGWGDIDGQIPLVLFAAFYDCKAMITERLRNQSLYEQIQDMASSSSFNHEGHDHHNHVSTNSFFNDNINEIIMRINNSQKYLLDYMVERNLKISNETLNFIMDNSIFSCPCYNMLGHSSESPCTLRHIIKYWKISNDKESKCNLVRKLAYKAWSRKDGVGLYKMEYYLNSFNTNHETLLNINEFIMEMITLDPVVIFKQDMLGWIINHSSSQYVKKLILYTLFNTLPMDPQRIHMVKLILNFVGDIDLKAIQLLKNIDKDNIIWDQLYSILIIHLYRRYVRRRITLEPKLCEAWADLFITLNPQRYDLTSVQIRFQDELFELLEVY
eukprot:jgi/Orpsp1_1/1176208/evm.model.c7180000056783.1